jgi:KUP system potassium uptake protein
MDSPSSDTLKTSSFGLMIAALGIVYGDIGTSPLYAFRLCFSGPSSLPVVPENVLGVLSLIFWSLVVLISVKYLSFVLRADNKGEGGILALTTLLTRTQKNPVVRRGLIILLGLFGASLLYGDGLITPVISVLSAVEGLDTVTPAFHPFIIPVSLATLVLLFMFQKHGSGAIGRVFGPVMTVWFITIGLLGLLSIIKNPAVLAGIDPRHAFWFFLHNRMRGFFTLGTVFLTLTGGEALYADVGHFGKKPIRSGWFYIVFPALMLNYLGQGAFLLRNTDAAENLFYRLAPQWSVMILVVLATVATVIASQAVISGVFSLARQSVQLGFFPRLAIVHTSHTTIGQVYVPVINGMLCVGTIILVLAFKKSDSLAGAYGVAVATTMLITTVFLFLAMRKIWKWNLFPAAGLCSVFLIMDLAFFCANLMKIKDGGWLSLAVASAAMFIMITWDDGRNMLRERIMSAALSIKDFLSDVIVIKPTRVPATAVFLAGNAAGVPRTLLHNFKHNMILHQRVIIMTVVTEEVPYIDDAQRTDVSDLSNGFYRLILRYGFSETPDVPAALSRINVGGSGFNPMQTTYFLGRETLIASSLKSPMSRWRKGIFSFLSRNACDASKFYHIPTNRVIEVGIQIDM